MITTPLEYLIKTIEKIIVQKFRSKLLYLIIKFNENEDITRIDFSKIFINIIIKLFYSMQIYNTNFKMKILISKSLHHLTRNIN